jgi:hypothetical protein
MSDTFDPEEFEFTTIDPYSKGRGELKIGPQGVRFILPRKKKGRSYRAAFDVEWSDVVSYECCEVNYCKDDKSWPLHEEIPKDYKAIGPAGMLFFFLRSVQEAYFQIWTYMPLEEVGEVQKLLKDRLEMPPLPGLAHHGTAAAVRHVVSHCEVLERRSAQWHDWIHRGPSSEPREKKFREKGPDYIFCREGMAIDFYGAGEQLEQMSTFWPWRVMKAVFVDDAEILYQWFEDSYTFRQQVWDEEERQSILEAAQNTLAAYRATDNPQELVLVRPWSFPSRFHRSWDKLEPFASKVTRNSFPPVFDFVEEDE